MQLMASKGQNISMLCFLLNWMKIIHWHSPHFQPFFSFFWGDEVFWFMYWRSAQRWAGVKGHSPEEPLAPEVRIHQKKLKKNKSLHESMRSVAKYFALCNPAQLRHRRSPRGKTTGKERKLFGIADQELPWSGRKRRRCRRGGSDAEVGGKWGSPCQTSWGRHGRGRKFYSFQVLCNLEGPSWENFIIVGNDNEWIKEKYMSTMIITITHEWK